MPCEAPVCPVDAIPMPRGGGFVDVWADPAGGANILDPGKNMLDPWLADCI